MDIKVNALYDKIVLRAQKKLDIDLEALCDRIQKDPMLGDGRLVPPLIFNDNEPKTPYWLFKYSRVTYGSDTFAASNYMIKLRENLLPDYIAIEVATVLAMVDMVAHDEEFSDLKEGGEDE